MPSLTMRRFQTATVAAVAVAGLGFASPAYAGGSYNNVTLDISGGNAAALSACVNYAKVLVKVHKDPQNNYCKNFAKASGGTVNLKNVSVLISQTGSSKDSYNRATINISGGDAVAVAGCVNFLQGTSTPNQTNACKNAAIANGGDVNLKNVDITVLQG